MIFSVFSVFKNVIDSALLYLKNSMSQSLAFRFSQKMMMFFSDNDFDLLSLNALLYNVSTLLFSEPDKKSGSEKLIMLII